MEYWEVVAERFAKPARVARLPSKLAVSDRRAVFASDRPSRR